MCSCSLEGGYLTESFLHVLVSQDLGRMHGFGRLADFGAGVCKAMFVHQRSESNFDI